MQRLIFVLCFVLSLPVTAMDKRVIAKPDCGGAMVAPVEAKTDDSEGESEQLSARFLLPPGTEPGALFYTSVLPCGVDDAGNAVDYVGRKIVAGAVDLAENPFDKMSSSEKMQLVLTYNLTIAADRAALIAHVYKKNPVHGRYLNEVIAPQYTPSDVMHVDYSDDTIES